MVLQNKMTQFSSKYIYKNMKYAYKQTLEIPVQKQTQMVRKLTQEGTKTNPNTNHWKQFTKYTNPSRKLSVLGK